MKKLSAFWRKNRILLIISISILTVLLLVARKYVTLNDDVLMAGIAVNVELEESAAEALKAYCAEALSHGDRWEKVRLSQVTLEDFADVNLAYRENYYTLTSIQSLNENGELDYILADQVALETLLKQQVFLDLRQFFTPEELEALGQAVIYTRSSEMAADESYPVAVDITQLPYIQKNTATADKVYFAIAAGSPRTEQVRQVWEYLNQ